MSGEESGGEKGGRDGAAPRGERAPGIGRWRWAWNLVIVFVPAVWGYNWVVMKQGLAYAGPFEFAAWRFLLGAAVLMAAMAVGGRSFRIPSVATVIWIGVLQTAANTALSLFALLSGPAGRSAILSYAMPFWVLLMAWPLLGERPLRLQLIATTAALIGIVLVFCSSTVRWRADAAVFATLAGVSMAVGTVLTRRLLRRASCDPLALTAWQMVAGGISLALVAVVVPGRATNWTPTFGLILAYEVIPATAMAWLFWIALLGRVDASLASLSLLATPVIGLLSSTLLLGERPSRLEAVGLGLILVALALVGPLAMRQARARPGR